MTLLRLGQDKLNGAEFFDNIIVAQLVKKSPARYGTRRNTLPVDPVTCKINTIHTFNTYVISIISVSALASHLWLRVPHWDLLFKSTD